MQLTPKTRATAVKALAQRLTRAYAFPEAGQEMADRIQGRLEQGDYDEIVDVDAFCAVLTGDLHAVRHDLHLAVYHQPHEAAAIASAEAETDLREEQSTVWWDQIASDNYGFRRLEVLTGNVGYLDVRYFAPVSLAAETVVAAMRFLEGCDALIFDLRQHGGGDPFTVQLIESYLFGSEPKLLLTLYERPTDKRQQLWTLPHVPGQRRPQIPVYVLTSGRTFSGGEDFTYTLQQHGRATVVGETTGGGAHTVAFKVVHGDIVVSMPTGYPTHPETSSNWEGTGVIPDIVVDACDALARAHVEAVERLIRENQERCPERARVLQWDLQEVQVSYAPLILSPERLQGYVGTYGSYTVALEDGALHMSQAGSRVVWALTPLTEARFSVDETYHARFVLDEAGRASAFVWLHKGDDHEITVPRQGD
jgi:hypothetical protein